MANMNNYVNDIDIIIERLKAYAPQKVILFGSAARDTARSDSDLDFFIIKDTNVPFVQRGRELMLSFFADSPYTSPVDFIVYTPLEFENATKERSIFVEHVLRDGKVVYET